MSKPHVKRWSHLHPRTAGSAIKLSDYVRESADELVVRSDDGEYDPGLNPEWIAWVERRRVQ
jgi:hypothetical protein